MIPTTRAASRPRPHQRLSLLLSLALLPACAAPSNALPRDREGPLAGFAWLTGAWCGDDDGIAIEEHWTQPRGGTLFGVNRVVKDGTTRSFEYLRIVRRDDAIVYVASPGGRPPTEFPLLESRDGYARFENPAHDFPQTIEYRLDGTALVMRIAGPIRGRVEETVWRLERAEPIER